MLKQYTEVVKRLRESFINGREYAAAGLIHPDHAASNMYKVTGNSVDFYAFGTGDKIHGTVTFNDGKSVKVRDEGGKVHNFKVRRGLPGPKLGEAAQQGFSPKE